MQKSTVIVVSAIPILLYTASKKLREEGYKVVSCPTITKALCAMMTEPKIPAIFVCSGEFGHQVKRITDVAKKYLVFVYDMRPDGEVSYERVA